jgi:superfamily II DNA or RNA helicase
MTTENHPTDDIVEDPKIVWDRERRWFTPAETTAAWLRQRRTCATCGREMPRDLVEGDHIQPWSQGGLTILGNLQALCVACNRRKGNQPGPLIHRPSPKVAIGTSPLRRWQVEALQVVAASSDPLLIEACPGAGKTRFALDAAAKMIASGEVNRVLIVVPTSRLVTQWVDAANGSDGGPQLPLAPAGWRPVQPLYAPWCGGVITYHTLFRQTTMLAALAAEPGYRTLAIFDEIHHAGTDGGWGIAAQQAFLHSATRIISLSGTPFRTKDPIAFVKTIDGRSVCDYSYGYGEALRDGARRPVHFAALGGTTVFRTPDSREHTVTFGDDLNERGESYRLRTALDAKADGGHLTAMLEEADRPLRHLRATGDHDAAGLVVCMDCDHADAIATLLTRSTGVRPIVACSRNNNPDDPAPGPGIAAFINSTHPWIVAVRMVSEGVDIRRLRVIVYATNVTAELYFRQIIGRVVRIDPANGDDDHGIVVLPADPELLAMAERIAREAPGAIQSPLITRDEQVRPDRIDQSRNGAFQPLASTGDLEFVFDSHGRRAETALVTAAERYIQAVGSPISAFELALAAASNPTLRDRLLSYES